MTLPHGFQLLNMWPPLWPAPVVSGGAEIQLSEDTREQALYAGMDPDVESSPPEKVGENL